MVGGGRRWQVAVKHVGFKAAASSAAKWLRSKGVSAGAAKKRAGAIIASAGRKASSAAKRRNPRLKRIRGA